MFSGLSRGRRSQVRFLKFTPTVTVATFLLLAAVCLVDESPAQVGGHGGQAVSPEQPAVKKERERFVNDAERRLTACYKRIAEMGTSLAAEIASRDHLRDDAMKQATTAQVADMSFKNATLSREVAEIAVVEYRDGIAREEELKLEGEVTHAEQELLRERELIEVSTSRLAKIRELSKGTDVDVALVKTYEAKLSSARNRESNAMSAVDRVRPEARAKLKLLRERTIPTVIKELESEALKARAEELAKKAVLEREKSKQSRLEALISNSARKPAANPVREAFTRAFDLDATVRAELARFAKNEVIDPDLGKAVTSLLSELERLIDQTEAEVARVRVDRLKAAFRGGAVPSSAIIQATVPAELSGFVDGIRRQLKECHRWIAHVGEPLLESIQSRHQDGSDSAVLAIRIEAARAAKQSTVLTRECALAELSTYREVTFPQKLAACEHDVVQTEEDLRTAIKNADQWDALFERNKNVAVESASSLDREYSIEAGRQYAELEMKRSRFALETAQQKLKVLKDFEKQKETKRLQAAVQKAISEDLASEASVLKLEDELKRSGGSKPELSELQRQSLELLERAFKLDETVRGKLAQISKYGKIDAQLEKGITDATNELEAVVFRAENANARAGFEALKDAIGRASPR